MSIERTLQLHSRQRDFDHSWNLLAKSSYHEDHETLDIWCSAIMEKMEYQFSNTVPLSVLAPFYGVELEGE